MKKHITKILFLFVMVIGLAVTSSAQQDDKDKKPPPRRDLPKIVVPKPTPRPPKNDRDKDKKPPESTAFINNKSDNNLS